MLIFFPFVSVVQQAVWLVSAHKLCLTFCGCWFQCQFSSQTSAFLFGSALCTYPSGVGLGPVWFFVSQFSSESSFGSVPRMCSLGVRPGLTLVYNRIRGSPSGSLLTKISPLVFSSWDPFPQFLWSERENGVEETLDAFRAAAALQPGQSLEARSGGKKSF